MSMAMVRATLKIPQYLFDMLMAVASVKEQKSVERYRGFSIMEVCVEVSSIANVSREHETFMYIFVSQLAFKSLSHLAYIHILKVFVYFLRWNSNEYKYLAG